MTNQNARLQTCRIVVADDNADVADSMALLLRLEGHEVTIAQDGTAALQAIEQTRPHIVLLDIGLPGLDGYEVARRVRQNLKLATKLVAVTGWGQVTDKEHALSAGFDLHLTKPVEPQLILDLCRTLHEEPSDRGD